MSLQSPKFQKRIEDFTCSHCGEHVKGTGYTNHCPTCLWSKHVDVLPGDREEICAGMMKPILVEGTTPKYRIVHKCEKCGAERRVDIAPDDNPAAMIALAKSRD